MSARYLYLLVKLKVKSLNWLTNPSLYFAGWVTDVLARMSLKRYIRVSVRPVHAIYHHNVTGHQRWTVIPWGFTVYILCCIYFAGVYLNLIYGESNQLHYSGSLDCTPERYIQKHDVPRLRKFLMIRVNVSVTEMTLINSLVSGRYWPLVDVAVIFKCNFRNNATVWILLNVLHVNTIELHW